MPLILGLAACATAPVDPPVDSPIERSAVWSPPRVINDDGRGVIQFDPALTTAPDGAVHAAWIDFRDGAGVFGLYHAERPAAGTEWKTNDRVSDMIGSVCRDDPDVAVDTAGAVHVVWSDYRNVHPDIFISTLAPGAADWSAPYVVNDDATETIQWVPALAADFEGGVWVVWSDYRDGDGAIYAARRDLEGEWATSVRIDDAPSGQQDRPAIAVAPSGHVFVAWLDMRNDLGDIYLTQRDPESGEWSPNIRLNTGPDGRQASPTLAIDNDGTVIVAWYDEHDGATIHSSTLAPSMSEWTADVRVSRPGPLTAERPAVASGAGTALITWYERVGIDGVVLASERNPSTDNGWSEPVRLDDSAASSAGRNPAAVIASDGVAHVAWYGEGTEGQKEIFYAATELRPPEPIEAAGRLIHEVSRSAPGCPSDGFSLLQCDGERLVLVAADETVEAGLDGALGRTIRLAGVTSAGPEAGVGCTLVHVLSVEVDTEACAGGGPSPAPGTGSVTGRLAVSALASPGGASVEIAGRRIPVGADGRFFADDVPTGSHHIRARAACALESNRMVKVSDGDTARVPDVALSSGDVDGNCVIDGRDLVAVGARYGGGPSDAMPCADVNGDGAVDLFDLASVSSALGAECPSEWPGGVAESAEPAPARSPVRLARTVTIMGLSSSRETLSRDDPTMSMVEPDNGSEPNAERAEIDALALTDVERFEISVIVSDASDIVGLDLTLRFDPLGTRVIDAMPDVPGFQAADFRPLPEGALVAANEVDPERGTMHVAVVGIDPGVAGTSGSKTLSRKMLGSMIFEVKSGIGSRPRVTGLQLAGRGGSRIPARVQVGGLVAAPAFHLWLPHAAAGAIRGRP